MKKAAGRKTRAGRRDPYASGIRNNRGGCRTGIMESNRQFTWEDAGEALLKNKLAVWHGVVILITLASLPGPLVKSHRVQSDYIPSGDAG